MKIHFYFVSGILEKTLTKFTKKITENENKVLILTANSSSSQNIDSAMWSYETFLPHILIDSHTMDNRLDSTVNYALNNKHLSNVNQKLLASQKILISQNFTYVNNPNVLIIFIDENSDIQKDLNENALTNIDHTSQQTSQHISPQTSPYILSIVKNYEYFNKVYVFTHKKFATNLLMNDMQMPFETHFDHFDTSAKKFVDTPANRSIEKSLENPPKTPMNKIFETSAQENLIESIWLALKKESLSVWEQPD